jgi:hypothetical protein
VDFLASLVRRFVLPVVLLGRLPSLGSPSVLDSNREKD